MIDARLTNYGDSGGTWSYANTAYGTHVRTCTPSGGGADVSVFSAARYFPAALNVQVRLVHRIDSPMVVWPQDFLTSSDGRFTAYMQTDGNFAIYKAGSGVIWQSGTGGNPGARLSLQTDGNLVIYRTNGSAAWATGTFGANHYLRMQSDGNLVLYRGALAVWASNTCCQ